MAEYKFFRYYTDIELHRFLSEQEIIKISSKCRTSIEEKAYLEKINYTKLCYVLGKLKAEKEQFSYFTFIVALVGPVSNFYKALPCVVYILTLISVVIFLFFVINVRKVNQKINFLDDIKELKKESIKEKIKKDS